jgi:hypothetical protein
MPLHPFALVALVLAPLAVRAADEENPFKSARVGDYARYNTAIKTGTVALKTVRTQTVTAAGEKEVSLRTVLEVNGKEVPTGRPDQKIDLTKPFDPAGSNEGVPGAANIKWEKLNDGKEKVKVGDREYDCTWTSYKPVVAGKEEVTGELKVWMSRDVPFVVKRTLNLKTRGAELSYSTELIEFGRKK